MRRFLAAARDEDEHVFVFYATDNRSVPMVIDEERLFAETVNATE